ncbi:MAG TPA: hypothetical protein VF453_06915, partial [Burkholderiaceae bacterium]
MSLGGLVLDDPVAAGLHPRDDWWPDALRLSPGVAFDVAPAPSGIPIAAGALLRPAPSSRRLGAWMR